MIDMPLAELIFSSLLAPLILTLLLEGYYFVKRGYSGGDFWTACILLNVITNLSLNLVLNTISADLITYFTIFIAGEILVVVVETLGYLAYFPDKKDFLLHTAQANMLTMLLGVVVAIVTLLI